MSEGKLKCGRFSIQMLSQKSLLYTKTMLCKRKKTTISIHDHGISNHSLSSAYVQLKESLLYIFICVSMKFSYNGAKGLINHYRGEIHKDSMDVGSCHKYLHNLSEYIIHRIILSWHVINSMK